LIERHLDIYQYLSNNLLGLLNARRGGRHAKLAGIRGGDFQFKSPYCQK
jgi:hypothetical protein